MFTRAQLERAANVKLYRGWILDGSGPARYGWGRADPCKITWLGRTLVDAANALMRSAEAQKHMQRLFSRVVTKLLKQNEKSAEPFTGTCLYRGPNGRRCGIGHLITNAAYDPKIEKNIFSRRSVLEALRESGVVAPKGSEIRKLLGDLQSTHDDHDPERWQGQFVVLAERYNLKMPRTISKS